MFLSQNYHPKYIRRVCWSIHQGNFPTHISFRRKTPLVSPFLKKKAGLGLIPRIPNSLCIKKTEAFLVGIHTGTQMAGSSILPTDLIKNGWFSETEAMWPGQKLSLKVEQVLFHQKSEYQDVLVFQSTSYGTVLVLDGVIQVTERDEFAYQEMLTHIPAFAHGKPEKVMIVGGGDGGILREVCRHESVKKVVMCELDRMVCDVSKQFFASSMAVAFNDPRLELIYQDAAKFLEETEERFDVIIVDSSDPVGPADVLFQSPFYTSVQEALSDGGVMCVQGECMWLHAELIEDVMKTCGSIFDVVDYCYTTIPTYPSGQIGFVICRKTGSNEDKAVRKPKAIPNSTMQAKLRYYTPQIHEAAFVLPKFVEDVVAKQRKC